MADELIRLKNSILQTVEQRKRDKSHNNDALSDLLRVVAKMELQIAMAEMDEGLIDEAAINTRSALSIMEEILKTEKR